MSFGKSVEKNEYNIRFCGIGGMGVILVSIILGKAAIYDKKNAIQTQSYGAEQRGSKVKSDVIISNKETINYPIIDNPDILIAFSQDAFEKYFSKTKKDGIILINSDLVHINEKINNLYKIPATTIAKEMKNERIINLIMLGALIKKTAIVSKESIIKSISDTVSETYIELNINAFQKGYEFL
ncbi:MAG: 2-oxoacid:acceptor oxidoreductase family protein [Promethearchaeota archaeon]